jgi:hypothetical protein
MDLRGFDLSCAQLQNADLSGADLSYSVLTGADLTSASLVRANLTGAAVAYADFTNVRMGGTLLFDLDLRSATGLESVIHRAPSAFSLASLYRSGGEVSSAFLQQCGVPPDLLSVLCQVPVYPAYLSPPQCLISYCDEDWIFVQQLSSFLIERGVRCYLRDPGMEDLHVSECKEKRPVTMGSAPVLLCCSRNSVTNALWRTSELVPFLKQKKSGGYEAIEGVRVLKLDKCLTRELVGTAACSKLSRRVVADFDRCDCTSDNCRFQEQMSLVLEHLQSYESKRI